MKNQIERPIINIDLDGVCYDFNGTLNKFIVASGRWPMDEAPDSGQTIITLQPKAFPEPQTWNYWEEWGMPKGEWFNWFRRGVEAGIIWAHGDAVEWAQPGLWLLSDLEYHIRLCTMRLNHFNLHAQAITSTASWLDKTNIPYRSLSFVGTEGKAGLDGEVLVDDNVGNVVDWAFANEKPAIIFDQPWNRDIEPFAGLEIYRCHGWAEVVDKIRELVPIERDS